MSHKIDTVGVLYGADFVSDNLYIVGLFVTGSLNFEKNMHQF